MKVLAIAWIVAFAAFGLGTAPSALAQAHAEKLFFIQRSKNANEVHYDARVNADGSLDAKNLVDGYWLNKAEDGSRQAITIIQKIAYGWSVEANGNGTHLLKLKAFPDRALTLLRVGGRWRAQMAIAGKPAYMTRLYIATDESGAVPKVAYIDLFGEDARSGAAVHEHIVRN